MAIGYCPRCGGCCEVTFSPYKRLNGKIIYPKRAKVFVMPHCKCNSK